MNSDISWKYILSKGIEDEGSIQALATAIGIPRTTLSDTLHRQTASAIVKKRLRAYWAGKSQRHSQLAEAYQRGKAAFWNAHPCPYKYPDMIEAWEQGRKVDAKRWDWTNEEWRNGRE
jgi:hypothetical protein